MAVVFAMLASYFLSRTLVPTMMHFLLRQKSPSTRTKKPTEKEDEIIGSGDAIPGFNR